MERSLAKVNKPVEPTENPQAISRLEQNEEAMKLVAEMLAGNIVDIRPQLDFTSELGFTYPAAEQTLKVKGRASSINSGSPGCSRHTEKAFL